MKYLFYCEKCKERMPVVVGAYSAFRRCPNYDIKERESNEDACMNRLTPYNIRDLRELLDTAYKNGSLKEGAVLLNTKNLHAVVGTVTDTYAIVYTNRRYVSRYKERKR